VQIKLETNRLCLFPLTVKQLRLWTTNILVLEKELNCSYQAEPLEGDFLEIVRGQAQKAAYDEANYPFHSFWFLVRKADRIVVGSAALKDVPDGNGDVEIGYGLGTGFEHNGYMTEAVKTMCDWILRQEGVSHVTAETDAGGTASQNVLKRCGFTLYKQEQTLWWRL
jgi:RimJ/RimL family protein N-acetyltransferase